MQQVKNSVKNAMLFLGVVLFVLAFTLAAHQASSKAAVTGKRHQLTGFNSMTTAGDYMPVAQTSAQSLAHIQQQAASGASSTTGKSNSSTTTDKQAKAANPVSTTARNANVPAPKVNSDINAVDILPPVRAK